MLNKEELKQKSFEFLKSRNTAVLATVSVDGKPQAATIYYIIDDDFNFYFITGSETGKFKNLKAKEDVALVVGFGPEPTTVHVGGKASILPENERSKILLEYADLLRVNEEIPILKLKDHGSVEVFKITPTFLAWLCLDKINFPEAYSESFHKII